MYNRKHWKEKRPIVKYYIKRKQMHFYFTYFKAEIVFSNSYVKTCKLSDSFKKLFIDLA